MSKILIIDDDTYLCNLLQHYLQGQNFKADVAYTGKSGLDKIKKETFDLVLCDFRLPNTDGARMLPEIKKINQSVPVIIITAYADIKMSVKLIKMGAVDYVTKPIQHEEIVHLINQTIKGNQQGSKDKVLADDFIMGESPQIKKILHHAEMVAPTDMTVLLQGETGSGKEYIARYIHNKSERSSKPFIALDCGAIPKELANSELFGHIKGSFTGAIKDKSGVFEEAKGGTLFLDEIGNLPHDVQMKLLRAIQERTISRIGDNKNIPVDVRIIAATNEDLFEHVQNKTFREDLFHRINEFKIEIPPLRSRKKDILIFAEYFKDLANQQLNKNIAEFDEEVKQIFTHYKWDGNIRELKNVIKRSTLLAEGECIKKEHLPGEIINFRNHDNHEMDDDPNELSLKSASNKAEREIILNALTEAHFNKSKAAKILNIDRKTLYNKIKQFDIELD